MKTAEKKSLSEQSKTCFLSRSGDGRNYARGLVDVVCAHGINVVFDVGDNDNRIDTLRHEALGANVVIWTLLRTSPTYRISDSIGTDGSEMIRCGDRLDFLISMIA
jgi:hypothetical protein